MNTWPYIACFLFGLSVGIVIALLLLRGKINNATIEIKKAKQKRNILSKQNFDSSIIPEPKERKKRKIINFKNRRK